MPSILFIHSGKSFLPEIKAYLGFFRSREWKANEAISPNAEMLPPYNVLWYFMGLDTVLHRVNKRQCVVHEYASASTPPFSRIKDHFKKLLNRKPDLRITLTGAHKGNVFPDDDVPLIIRKQGVADAFFSAPPSSPVYDFIYTGSALRKRATDTWLKAFIKKMPSSKILLVGHHEKALMQAFAGNQQVVFETAQPIESIPALLSKARWAVNYVPNMYPYTIQPSTKLLEYCAAGIPVVTNKYPWVEQFADSAGAAFFTLSEQFANLEYNALRDFPFKVPKMDDYRWSAIFSAMDPENVLKNFIS
jgi:hypothetical protein